MQFFIATQEEAILSMLTELIEDFDLGKVAGETNSGCIIDSTLLIYKKIDILIIDLLLPAKEGLNIIKELSSDFHGKIIIISSVEDKEIIGKAYALGIEYYVTKPVTRLEILGVIHKVIDRIKLQNSIDEIQSTLNFLKMKKQINTMGTSCAKKNIATAGQFLLTEIGMITESGSKDILSILEYFFEYEKLHPATHEFPSLKNAFINSAIKKFGVSVNEEALKKEIKASEQRARRAIFQTLNHLASLGLTDYSNPKFEEYASKYFDFTEVRKKMRELETDVKEDRSMPPIRINMKKFIKVLYLEAKKLL